jgi:Na+/pantothenate symporter
MSEPSDVPSTPAEVRLPRKEALRLHATLALGLVLCVTAFWFEVSRALGGNALSWAYVFEWPLLAVFAVYMWWQLLHPGRDNRLNRKVKSLDPSFNSMLERWEESKDDLERSRAHEDE